MNMQEMANQLIGMGSKKMQEIGFMPFFAAVGISLLCSLFIAGLYTRFYRTRSTGSQVHRAFPLLGVSITGIFVAIQFSLPLSLGLLGALSIVRFRTPIKEPEEIGFIMLVVATSICCATFNILFLGVILAVAVIGLLMQGALHLFNRGCMNDGTIIATMPGSVYEARASDLLAFLKEKLPAGRIDSVTQTGGQTSVCYSFVKAGPDVVLSMNELGRKIEGAQANVYFNRSGEV